MNGIHSTGRRFGRGWLETVKPRFTDAFWADDVELETVDASRYPLQPCLSFHIPVAFSLGHKFCTGFAMALRRRPVYPSGLLTRFCSIRAMAVSPISSCRSCRHPLPSVPSLFLQRRFIT